MAARRLGGSPAVLLSLALNAVLVVLHWSVRDYALLPVRLEPVVTSDAESHATTRDAPRALQECPPMSAAWMARVESALDLARRIDSPDEFTKGVQGHTAKARLLRLIYVDGLLHVAHDGHGHFGVRGLVARLQFLRLVDKFPWLPAFDVVVNTHDWPTCFKSFHHKPVSRFPAFSYSVFTELIDEGGARKVGCDDILFPDFTEDGWPEAAPPAVLRNHPLDYLTSTWRRDLAALSAARPFEAREPLLTFRGSAQTYANTRSQYEAFIGANRTSTPAHPMLNIGMRGQPYMAVTELSRYRYLLHLPGNGYSSRLKYLVYSGSLVFRDRTDHWVEWWSQGLVANEHYVLVMNAADAAKQTRWALRSPDDVERIRRNAAAYLADLPAPDTFLCHLVRRYAERVLNYTVRATPGTVDLVATLMDPYYPRISEDPPKKSGVLAKVPPTSSA